MTKIEPTRENNHIHCMTCSRCSKGQDPYFSVCTCEKLCYDCYITTYVIYNESPFEIIKKCQNCNEKIVLRIKQELLRFTIDY